MTENDIRYAIREAVAKAGTQGALARKTGVPQSTISDYLNGRYAIGNMNLSTLFKLFPELSVDFFGDIESEPRSLMEKQLLKLFSGRTFRSSVRRARGDHDDRGGVRKIFARKEMLNSP